VRVGRRVDSYGREVFSVEHRFPGFPFAACGEPLSEDTDDGYVQYHVG
jgi:hypothetical protein